MSDDAEAVDSLFTEPEADPAPHDLFTKDGQPCLFYLHHSITGNSRDTLTDQIELHGGAVVDNARGVDTVLIALGTKRQAIQDAFHGRIEIEYRRVHVEYSAFIGKCIERQRFKHHVPQRKPMPGIQPGTGRNKFTPEHDEKLANWLAQRIAFGEEGGRSGMKVYQALVDAAHACPEMQGWARLHTAYSFRERYRKNKSRFDDRIEEICKDNEIVPGQLHIQTRNLNNLPKKRSAKYMSDSEEEDEDGPEEEEEEEEEEGSSDEDEDNEPVPTRVLRRSQRHSLPQRTEARRKSTLSEPTISLKGKERAENHVEEPVEYDEEESAEWEDMEHMDIPEENPPTYRSNQATQDMLAPPTPQASTSRRRVSFPTIATLSPAAQPSSQSRRNERRPTQTASSSSVRAVAPKPIPAAPQSSQPSGSQVPKRRGRVPMNAQRDPASPAEAPYRNTRARSRSVDPTAATAARLPPAKRQRRVGPIVQQPIHEEARESSPYEDVFGPPMQETVAEEMDVAKILTTSVQTQSMRLSAKPRPPSMETDDNQIRKQLFGNTSRSPLRPKKTPTAAELLRDFEEASETSMTPIIAPRTNRPLAAFPLRSLRHNMPPGTRPEARLAQPAPLLSTPPRVPRVRVSDSDSSVATSYPATGTRASALKKELAHKEKLTPYKPPRGTRADLMSQ